MTQHRLVIDVWTDLDGLAAAEHVGKLIDASPLVELASPVYYRPWEDDEDEPDYSAPDLPTVWEWLSINFSYKWFWIGVASGGIALAVAMAFG